MENKFEELKKYAVHLQDCNTNKQNLWDEAMQAMNDTPSEDRDDGYYMALADIELKRKHCTCGLSKLISL